MSQATTDALARRERVVIASALAVLVVAAWAYLVHLRHDMADMDMAMSITMPDMHPWSWAEFASLVVMWVVMMVAMMLPAAAPMVLTFATLRRRRLAEGRPSVPTAIFVLGYLAVWALYSLVAATAQVGLHASALLSPAMAAANPLFAGGLLIAAGAFQWTPLKRACLVACRSPLSFLMSRWREGRRGALAMGVRHGLYCLGCCWALMALLFVAGVMNLLWIAALAVTVLLEKVMPGGELVGRVVGVACVVAGVFLIVRSVMLA
jgi:predicted metal-binding membrane protein